MTISITEPADKLCQVCKVANAKKEYDKLFKIWHQYKDCAPCKEARLEQRMAKIKFEQEMEERIAKRREAWREAHPHPMR